MLQARTGSQAADCSSHLSHNQASSPATPPSKAAALSLGGTTHEDSGVCIAFQVREQYAHGFVPFDSDSQSEFGISSPKLKKTKY